MESRYFGKPIQVITDEDATDPRLFRFSGEEHVVTEILESWPDNGFGTGALPRKPWWKRHHRKYFRVLTESGDIFEIYYDRGPGKSSPASRKWYITRRFHHVPKDSEPD